MTWERKLSIAGSKYPYEDLDECCRTARNLLIICTDIARQSVAGPVMGMIGKLHGRIDVKPADDTPDQLIVLDEKTGVYERLDMHVMALHHDPIYLSALVLERLARAVQYHNGFLTGEPL